MPGRIQDAGNTIQSHGTLNTASFLLYGFLNEMNSKD